MAFGDRLRRLCKFQKEAGAMGRVDRDLVAIRLVVGRSKPLGARRLSQGGATGRRDRRMEAPSARSQSRQRGTGPQRQRHRNPSACRPRLPHRHDDARWKVGLRTPCGFGGIRTRADPRTDPRWIGRCTSQGQEGKAPSRVVQCAARQGRERDRRKTGRFRDR